MASVDNTSGPAPQRKERCMLQCALSLKEEKSSCFPMLVQSLSGSTYISLYSNSLDQIWQSHMQILKGRIDRLFQPMFAEYFTPQSIAVSPVQEAAAPRAVVLADSPVSTSID
ncbi:hypothetical protein Tco_0832923 [Tanacetum coccineum]